MKNEMKSIGIRITTLFLALFATITAFAQETVDNTKVSMWKFSVYGGYFPMLVFGIVIVFLVYLGYNYWKNEMTDDHHMPHHQ